MVAKNVIYVLLRYASLGVESVVSAERLEDQVREHAQYREQYGAAISHVMTSRQQLTQLSDTSGSKQEIEAKQSKINVSYSGRTLLWSGLIID